MISSGDPIGLWESGRVFFLKRRRGCSDKLQRRPPSQTPMVGSLSVQDEGTTVTPYTPVLLQINGALT